MALSALTSKQFEKWVKPPVFLALAIPFLWLVWQWYLAFSGLPNGMGFNPQEVSNRFSGDWALRYLILGLMITPLATLTGYAQWIMLRRMIGLYAFFYVAVHMISFIWLDKLFAWAELWQDVLRRPYITVGMAAFLILTPLAITSSRAAIKRLGARNWARLHKLVYAACLLSALHFIIMRKGFQAEPLIYLAIIAALLAFRLIPKRTFRRKKPAAVAG